MFSPPPPIRFAVIFFFSSFHNLYSSLCYMFVAHWVWTKFCHLSGLSCSCTLYVSIYFVISVGCIVFVRCMYQFISMSCIVFVLCMYQFILSSQWVVVFLYFVCKKRPLVKAATDARMHTHTQTHTNINTWIHRHTDIGGIHIVRTQHFSHFDPPPPPKIVRNFYMGVHREISKIPPPLLRTY